MLPLKVQKCPFPLVDPTDVQTAVNGTARTGFLVTELPKPAVFIPLFILILLLRTGINPNPGPHTCSPFNHKIIRSQASVWCHICGWIPLECSGPIMLKHHHRNSYCPTCTANYILILPKTNYATNFTTDFCTFLDCTNPSN